MKTIVDIAARPRPAAFSSVAALAVTAAAVSVPLALHAQSPSTELRRICNGERVVFAPPAFATFDADRNQHISRAEAEACPALHEIHERLDLDADQALTREEYSAFADVWRRRARSLDGDG